MNENELDIMLNYENQNNFDLILIDDRNLNFDYGSLSEGIITDNLLFYYDFMVYQTNENIYSLVNPEIVLTTGFTSTANTFNLQIDDSINYQILNSEGGYLASSYIPPRNMFGWTLNFLLNKETGTTGNLFFEMGTPEINGINFSYTGDYISFTERLEREDSDGNLYTKIITSGQSVVIHDNPWINLTITFKRDESLYHCNDIMDWVPQPEIITGYTGCTIYTGFTGTTGVTFYTGDTSSVDFTIYSGYTGFTGSTGCTCESMKPSTQSGKLKFYINARPVYEVCIEEPILTSGDTGFSIATDFIGEIGLVSMYTRPLTIPEIIRNYYQINTIYNIKETFGGPKIILPPNLTNY